MPFHTHEAGFGLVVRRVLGEDIPNSPIATSCKYDTPLIEKSTRLRARICCSVAHPGSARSEITNASRRVITRGHLKSLTVARLRRGPLYTTCMLRNRSLGANEGEFWRLERAWEKAEKIVTIADSLLVTSGASEFIEWNRWGGSVATGRTSAARVS